jgi:uncharacterized membrane protein YjjP (DUF1212 family)
MADSGYLKLRHRDIEQIALVCLNCARVLMQSGSSGRVVHACGETLAKALGVDLLGLRVGYTSIAITLGSGANTITRMVTLSEHGVNHRLNQAVRALVREAVNSRLPPAEITARLDALVRQTPRYPAWLVAVAVGLACAAFGELLGTDHRSFLPVFLAGGLGQCMRHQLLRINTNLYVVATATALLAAGLVGMAARLAGSNTVDLAMFAATLLLVPGISATNAQADVVDGYPTLGSARAVSVLTVMLFVSTGIWLARLLLGTAP